MGLGDNKGEWEIKEVRESEREHGSKGVRKGEVTVFRTLGEKQGVLEVCKFCSFLVAST